MDLSVSIKDRLPLVLLQYNKTEFTFEIKTKLGYRKLKELKELSETPNSKI